MHQFRRTVGGVAFALLIWGVLVGPVVLEAQVTGPGPDGRWPLQPNSPGNHTLAPFMEGWYENEDGTYTISFGYSNANLDTLYIPVGEGNFLDPAQFDGVQSTIFFPGHHRGIFTVTLPAEMKDQDVWWTLTKTNGDVTRVPGRTSAIAYELDWVPRPHGGLPPSVTFDSQSGVGRGPPGIMAERTQTVAVGSPLTLSVNTTDPSERDPDDARSADVPLRVVWSQLQGPGPVEYTRHESNPLPEVEEPDPAGGAAAAARRQREPRGPEVVPLSEGYGTASVIVTFSAPGEYIMRARVDNFSAPDSSDNDNCCFTNGYVRVSVR
jgi:hypothetical protein